MTLVKPSSLQLTAPLHGLGRRGSSDNIGPYRATAGGRTRKKDSGAGTLNGGGVLGDAELRLTSSCSFVLEVAGDVELSDGSGHAVNSRITYHDTFRNNGRQFLLVPKSIDDASDGPKVRDSRKYQIPGSFSG